MRAAALLALLAAVGGCASPLTSPTPPPAPTTSPAPSPGLQVACWVGDPGASSQARPGCAAEWRAALAAVSGLGYSIVKVQIIPYGFPCGFPWTPPAAACLAIPGPDGAYVYFAGSDKVAAITFVSGADGSLSGRVVDIRVPGPESDAHKMAPQSPAGT